MRKHLRNKLCSQLRNDDRLRVQRETRLFPISVVVHLIADNARDEELRIVPVYLKAELSRALCSQPG